eukprot:CAMPEP_0179050484 /NCGR_PEP_ID=MMETSP0796-20121207/20750_1 /TAXON_ID=73915 /ORGANISM="Pyrodinium bahamense, Strain pbaha01" /LENGTH=583 /DNA_ID=CAMNT_0020746989 /DNA_START=65 /DNA_END=1816 /DNA_ORIENTATION=-
MPEQCFGDLPASPPESPSADADALEVPTSSASTTTSRLSTPSRVRRSRFFLEHESGTKLHDVYEVESTPLGEGGFGTVCRARMRSANSVVRAVKAIKKRSAATEVMVQEEAAILRSLDHPYICRLFETFDGPKCMYLVMEYVDGQELFHYIQEAFQGTLLLNEDFAAHIMSQVFSALQYCHGRCVVHRDLKPENIMVQKVPVDRSKHQLEIKLIDFGLAACSTHTSRPASGSFVGTYCYLAPEAQLGGKAHPASDVWSAGMVLHTLLVGGLPEEAIRRGEKPLAKNTEAYAGVSAPAKDLLAGLIRGDPGQRFTAADAGASAWLRAEAGRMASKQHITKTMDAFTAFHRSTMLRRAFLTALAMQMADQQIIDLQKQFLSIDVDKNGRISKAELAKSIAAEREHLGEGIPPDVSDWVEAIFDSVDTDGSEEIEYTEWVAAAFHAGEDRSDQAIRAAFRVFDVDGSGKISIYEIARVTTQNVADIKYFMPKFDLNGDGELDFEEFRELICTQPLSRSASWGSKLGKIPSAPRQVVARAPSDPLAAASPSGKAGASGLDAAQKWCSVQWKSLGHTIASMSRAAVVV